jgi:medium-chain acyl-[acyl-carrier-protein] hydrolase
LLTKLEQDYYLRALDVDISGRFMPSAILTRMQEIAEDHANLVGVGRVDLVEEKSLAWVLTRLHLEMKKYPKIGQTIKVATWPCPPTKITIARQFSLHDMEGGELGRAATQWVLLDINERAIRRIERVLGSYPHDAAHGVLLPEPKKLFLPPDMELAQTRKVMYSEVDMNKHMNNAKYANWICELFNNEQLTEKQVRVLKINYIAEAYLGQEVEIYTSASGSGTLVCGKTDGKVVFDGYIEWEE